MKTLSSRCLRLAGSDLLRSIMLSGCCVLVLASCAAVTGVPLNGHPDLGDTPTSSLELKATADKEAYALGEPVYLNVRLRNISPSPMRILKRLRPDYGLTTIRIVAPDGRSEGFVPLGVVDSDAVPENLPPGAELGSVFPIFFGANGWTFPQPGRYRVDVQYQSARPRVDAATPLDRVRVRSTPITITVASVDSEAGTFLIGAGRASNEAGKFLVWQSGDHLRRGIAQLEDLIQRFPQSIIADYARLMLGLSLSRSFKDYSIDRLRPPDHQKSLAYLGQVSDDTVPRYLRVQKHLALARDLAGVNQFEAARESLARVRALIQGHSELQGFADQILRDEESLK
jgi:hypothetical protein